VEYAEMAKACGLKGVKVGSVAELEEAVAVKRKWMERGWNVDGT
jgi:TPP-dependent trihydroxycyclohexane-1,2-dione (THcHDO) dehydratase